MSTPPIENEVQHRLIRSRISALDEYLRAISDLQCLARTHRETNRIEDEDLRDLAPLEDAAADIAYTREHLLDAADAWMDLVEYGRRRDANAPRVISIQG